MKKTFMQNSSQKVIVNGARIPSYEWVVGRKYYVECGIWSGICSYVGARPVGKRVKHIFTYGDSNNWDKQFNLVDTKGHFHVFDYEVVALLDNGDKTTS